MQVSNKIIFNAFAINKYLHQVSVISQKNKLVNHIFHRFKSEKFCVMKMAHTNSKSIKLEADIKTADFLIETTYLCRASRRQRKDGLVI